MSNEAAFVLGISLHVVHGMMSTCKRWTVLHVNATPCCLQCRESIPSECLCASVQVFLYAAIVCVHTVHGGSSKWACEYSMCHQRQDSGARRDEGQKGESLAKSANNNPTNPLQGIVPGNPIVDGDGGTKKCKNLGSLR